MELCILLLAVSHSSKRVLRAAFLTRQTSVPYQVSLQWHGVLRCGSMTRHYCALHYACQGCRVPNLGTQATCKQCYDWHVCSPWQEVTDLSSHGSGCLRSWVGPEGRL